MKSPRRRLIGGLIAVLAIVAGSVGAGALVAQAQPNSVTIDLVDGSNIVGPYFIQGSVSWSNTEGGVVSVAVTGPSGGNVYCSETSYPASATSWSCPSASLEYGQNTVVVTATESTDVENPLSTTVTVTRGSTQPATITSPADGAGGLSTTASFAGTGAHMGTVTLQARPATAPPTAFADVCPPVAVGEDGLWSCDATFPGADDYVVRALGTLLGGLDGVDSAEQTYRVDSFVLLSPADESVIDWSPTGTEFSGSTSITESTTVDVFDTGAESLLCTATVADGVWACSSAGSLAMGTRNYTAAQTTRTFQVNDTVTVTVRPGAPGYTTGNPTIIEGGDVLFEGTTTAPNVGVTVGIDGIGSCTTLTVETLGDPWSCSIDDVPFAAAGTYPIDVYQTYQLDPYTQIQGAVTTATLTISPGPTLEITSPGPGAAAIWTAGDFLVVMGTSPSSAPVDVYLDDDLETPVCSLGSVDGSWSCPGIAIDPGPHTLTAWQEGEDDAVVAFDILLPAPDLPNDFTFDPGTTDAAITGTRAWDAPIRVTVFEDFGEGVGAQLATTTCASGAIGTTFNCVLDLSALTVDRYVVRAQHFLADRPEVRAEAAQTSLYIQPSGPVALDCAFAPSGVTISTTGPVNVSIYTLEPLADDAGWGLASPGDCGGSAGYSDDSVPSWYETPFGGGEGPLDCDTGCVLSDLAPGIYEVYYFDYSYSTESERFDYLFRIPETPTAAAASSGNSIALSGLATAGDTVRIVGNSGATLCETTSTTRGTWVCGFTASTHTTARAISIDPQSGGMSAYSASHSIPVFVAPPAPPAAPVTPPTLPTLPDTAVGPALVQWLLSFDGDLMNLRPGDKFSATIAGMPEGWTIEVIMHSTPRSLGTTTATGEAVTMQLTVPDDIESGSHRIEVVATTPLGTSYFENADAQVIGGVTPVDEPVDEPAGNEEGGTGITGTGGSTDRSDPGAPSALTGSLATLAQIVANPVTVAIAGGLALALLLLVALPTELLNNSLSSNSSRLGRVYGTIDRAMTRAQDWLIRFTRSRATAAGLLVVLVAVIYGFVDPGFGFDIVSLRLVLSLAIALFVLSFVASWISGIIIRRAWGAMGVVAMQPTIILFAVIGVIVARVLDFSPGFLVGVAIGLELIQASKRVTARAVCVQLGVVTGLALTAWVAYSIFEPGNDFVGLLVEDTMVALTAEGLTGALIAIFPLKFLDGRDLWEVSKRLWVAAFLLVATAFALLVLPTAIEGTEVADYGVWLIVFAVFGLISLTVWFIFARADKRAAAADRQKVDA